MSNDSSRPEGPPDIADRELADLAGELVRLAADAPDRLAQRVASLTTREQAELALRLPAAKRLELLLHARHPMRLVRALPASELYLTAREVTPTDALPLLALASAPQIRHILDLESWRKDRFDPERAGAWVAVLLESGDAVLQRWLRSVDEEALSLLFSRWIGLKPIELDDTPDIGGHGETEAGSDLGLVSPDGNYRFSPKIQEHGPVMRGLLALMFTEHRELYERVIWSSLWELPSELEERALGWRQSRLEEHGFPPWDEALAVYAPPSGSKARPQPLEQQDPDCLPAARSPLRQLAGVGSLVPAIDCLPDTVRERVLHEFVSLANHLLVADIGDPGNPDAHKAALEKAGGYVAAAVRSRGGEDPTSISRVLQDVPIVELFREGYAPAAALQQRAHKLRRQGWVAAHTDALELLDEPIRQRVGGLLEPRPLFYDLNKDTGGGVLRDFRAPEEFAESGVALEMAELCGQLFVDVLGLDLARTLQARTALLHPTRFSTLLLTLLAWNAARQQQRGDPLPPDVAAEFLRNVASRRTAAPDAPARAMDTLVRQLADQAGLQPREISLLEGFGRFCLEELAEECGNLDPGVPADPRAISCLLLAD